MASKEKGGESMVEELDLSNRRREIAKPSPNELAAIKRVNSDSELGVYATIIFADWARWEDHMTWVATAPKGELLEWAKAKETQFAHRGGV
jgi:hypothetical protein